MNRYFCMKIIKRLFYPLKESKAIFFQACLTFLLLGSIFLVRCYVETHIENKYQYLSDTSIYEEESDNNTLSDLSLIRQRQNEKLEQYRKIFRDPQMKCEELYVISAYVLLDSTTGYRQHQSLYICKEVEEAFGYTSEESFKGETVAGQGIYCSENMAMELGVGLNDLIMLNFNSNWVPIPIVGIFKSSNDHIQYRIYCNMDLSDLIPDWETSDQSLNVKYLFMGSKPIDRQIFASYVKNKENVIKSKQFLLDEETMVYEKFFKIADIYSYLSALIMGISLCLLVVIQQIKSIETYFIERIYYRSKPRQICSLVFRNTLLVGVGFCFSKIILLLISGICYSAFSAFLLVNSVYYIISAIEIAMVVVISFIMGIVLQNKGTFKEI